MQKQKNVFTFGQIYNIMKKIFTTLAIASLSVSAFAQTITQNATPDTVNNGGSVSCQSSNQTTQVVYNSSDNSYMRAFKLSDFGINYDYKITKVAFGVQRANKPFTVNVALYTLNGTLPSGTMNYLNDADVNVAPANNLGMVDTGTSLIETIPSGGSFVVEVFHDGTGTYDSDNEIQGEVFAMGTHPGNQTGPSYLSSSACSLPAPTATGTGSLASFGTARWVMTVYGQNALGVTEVLNSKDLQIYPNPVKDVLKFRFANQLKSETIEIYDMNGKLVQSVKSKNVNELNMSSYAKGNYILKVKASDNQVYVQKIIKE